MEAWLWRILDGEIDWRLVTVCCTHSFEGNMVFTRFVVLTALWRPRHSRCMHSSTPTGMVGCSIVVPHLLVALQLIY